MKKVLHISKYYHPFIGGIEQVASDCVQSLHEKYNQQVICFNHEKGTKTDTVDGITVTRVNCQAKVASQSIALMYGRELKKIMKSFQPDIVIFHYPNPFVAHYLKKYLKKKKIKFVLYWHLDITKQKILGKFFYSQNKYLLRCADKIIATSPNYIEGSPWLLQNKDKCIVLPCCVNEKRIKYDKTDVEKAEEIKSKYKDKIICFAFGRHVQYKGLSYLIESSKLLDDRFAVLIAGKGPLTDDLMEQARKDKKVEFLGKISDDDLKAYLLACDIFCFPSITKNEAFGIGLAEAMFFQKPVITFHIDGSGVNYVNLKNVTGIECDNMDITQYADAIRTLGSNSELRKRYGQEGFKRVIKNFTFEAFKERINCIIADLSFLEKH